MVIGPSTPWQLTAIQWAHADHACYLEDDWRCHARTGPAHMTNHEIFAYETLLSVVFISTCLDYDHLEHYGANAQNTYRRIHKSYCSRPIHTKRCYWAVILERIESRTLESHESLECLVCQVCQCLSWKTYTCCKKQSLKSETKLHTLYAIYWTTLLPWDWRTNSNGANCLWKKTPCWIHLMPGNVATKLVRVVLISPSERGILLLFSL